MGEGTSCVLKEKRESGAEISRENPEMMPEAMQLEQETKAPQANPTAAAGEEVRFDTWIAKMTQSIGMIGNYWLVIIMKY